MVWIAIYMILGTLAVVFTLFTRLDLKIPEDDEFRQIEKEINRWLNLPIITSEEIPIETEKKIQDVILIGYRDSALLIL